jgi:mannose-6-phosphate isomerase-like protein (cupin superfamily)
MHTRPTSCPPIDPHDLKRVDYDLTMSGDSVVSSLLGAQIGTEGSDFVVVEWTDAGDSGYDWIAPHHIHHRDDEAWYVLEGTMRFRIGDRVCEVGPGGAVMAPKGMPHAYGNARRGERARYLLVTTPRIRALVQALHRPGASDYAAIFRAHDSELLTGDPPQ